MATTARNQITIVDLNDAKSVQVYFTASLGFSQLYNPDTHQFAVNYGSTPNIITPKVYESGDPADHLAKCKNVAYTVNGLRLTASVSNASYTVNANGTLSIKANLATDLNITFEADYVDSDNITSHIGGSFAVLKNESSGALFSVVLTCPKGNIFDKSVSGDLTVTAQAKRGSVNDDTNVTYAFQQFNIKTSSWKAVANGRANGKTLTVKPEDVLNFQTFKCIATDAGGTDKAATAEELVTFQDLTDPYVLELYCPTGEKIVNGTGSTPINARIWQGGNKIEDENTPLSSRKFDYAWSKLDKDGRPQNWSGTSSNVKTGNPITVLASEVNTKTTIVCEVTKNKPMGVLARNQITIVNVKDGQPSYTYVRYSDDGGKTFTAAKTWDEPLTKEICPDVSFFNFSTALEHSGIGTDFSKTLEVWNNRIACTTPILCTWDIAYNVAEGYSIFVMFYDGNRQYLGKYDGWKTGSGIIRRQNQQYITFVIKKNDNVVIADIAETFNAAKVSIKTADFGGGRNLYAQSEKRLQAVYGWTLQVLDHFGKENYSLSLNADIPDGIDKRLMCGIYCKIRNADGSTSWNFASRIYMNIDADGRYYAPNLPIIDASLEYNIKLYLEHNMKHKDAEKRSITIRDVKIEQGAECTPWTPAPEDQQFGTTPGKYAGMAVSDKPYPPLNVSDYTWTKMEGHDGRGVSSIKRFYGVSTSETKEPAAYSENRPTLSATNKYLWTYDLITFSDGTTQQTTHAVTGTYGDTGDPGKAGDAAYTISCSPSAAVFNTDEQGNIIADTSVTLKVMKGKDNVDINGKMSVLSSTNFTKGEARVNGTVVTLAKKGVAMQSVSVGGETTTLPVTSGSVELQIAVDATTKLTYTVPFSVNVTKYMSSMYIDLKQFKRTFTEFKGTTANMESFRSEVEQTATNIGVAIYDALGEVGVKIKGKDRSVNIKAGVFKVETPLGDIPLIIDNGKISMSLLDAKKIIAEGIKAQTIDAEQATFENLKVVDGEFSGDLKGVSGSFKTLRCVNDLGQEVGSISFGSDGKIWFDGDLYHQGEVNGRTARFYTSSLWCRGSFGASNRNTLLVRNNRAYYYPDGTHKPAFEENLNMKTSDSGAQYYEIYCHSYFSGLIHGVAGMPIDTLIIVNANNSYTYELWMAETQRVMVINGNDSGHTEFNIYTNGNKTRWDPGEVAEVVQVPSSFMTPQVNKSVLGHGLLVGAFRNNDW